MTVLDTRPSSSSVLDIADVLSSRVLAAAGTERTPSDVGWDALIRTLGTAPVWFRFTDPNPLTGRSYARSRWEELPHLVAVLARRFVRTGAEWDALVAADRVVALMGPDPWRVPFTMTPLPGLPSLPPFDPPGVCGDCAGTGLSMDEDVSMTGTAGAVFLCWCMGEPA